VNINKNDTIKPSLSKNPGKYSVNPLILFETNCPPITTFHLISNTCSNSIPEAHQIMKFLIFTLNFARDVTESIRNGTIENSPICK
jgi:hypothetical protein